MNFKSILHPTDFSEQSMVAFNHALKLALMEKCKLTIIYTMLEDKDILDWDKFPKVRDTLSSWGLIHKNANKGDVYDKLGIIVKKVIGKDDNVLESVVGMAHKERVDLIVLSTHGREGPSRWINPSISESISREVMVPTLFIPNNSKHFVSAESGGMQIKEILLPIDYKPSPEGAVDFSLNFQKKYSEDNSRLTILHVSNSEDENMPPISIPDDNRCSLRVENSDNKIDETIIEVADEINADLILIPTEGHTGFIDVLFGSTSEQILRKSNCPILTIPVSKVI